MEGQLFDFGSARRRKLQDESRGARPIESQHHYLEHLANKLVEHLEIEGSGLEFSERVATDRLELGERFEELSFADRQQVLAMASLPLETPPAKEYNPDEL